MAGHQHIPGECRECWKPCRERVDRDEQRCHDCLIALVSCPDTRIRRALLEEQPVDTNAVQLLADDANPVIAREARMLLAGLDADAEPATVEPHAAAPEVDLQGADAPSDDPMLAVADDIDDPPIDGSTDESSYTETDYEVGESDAPELTVTERTTDARPRDDAPNGWGF